MAPASLSAPAHLGRYALGPALATGGMASVHFGLALDEDGTRRPVAIKRMLPEYAQNPDARAMFLDEAHLAGRISHPRVVRTLEVVERPEGLFLIMEYVEGEALDVLLAAARAAGQPVPAPIAVALAKDVLSGLHAAHEAVGEDGAPLELVHRDLSPHNVLVDTAGRARVLDFGVARARGRLQRTRDGQLKGKLAYLSPEQVHGDASRRSDVFAAGVLLWETLAGRQLFDGRSEAEVLSAVLLCKVPRLAACGVDAPEVQRVLDGALTLDPDQRYPTAQAMMEALAPLPAASAAEVSAWLQALAGPKLAERAEAVRALLGLDLPAPAAAPVAARQGATASSRRTALLAAAAGVLLVVAGAMWSVLRGTAGVTSAADAGEPAASGLTASPGSAAPGAVGGAAGSGGVGATPRVGVDARGAPGVEPVGAGATPGVGASGPGAPGAVPTGAEASPRAGVGVRAAAGTGPGAGTTAPGTGVTTRPAATGTREASSPADAGGPGRGTAHAPAAGAPRPRVTPPGAAACDPPFTIDSSGVKRFKVECLR